MSLMISFEKNKENHYKYVDVYATVKDMFLTNKGYYDGIARYVDKTVFDTTNIYSVYGLSSQKYKEPLKIDFSLQEKFQKNAGDIIIVYMIYTVNIEDADKKSLGGSKDVPIIFSVRKTENSWYIEKKYEQA